MALDIRGIVKSAIRAVRLKSREVPSSDPGTQEHIIAVDIATMPPVVVSASVEGPVDQGVPASLANAWAFKQTDGTDVLGTVAHPTNVAAQELPLPDGAATAAGVAAVVSALTGGAARAIARGGVKGATVAADITSTAQGADHQAADVQLYHGNAAIDPRSIRALTKADIVSAGLVDPRGKPLWPGLFGDLRVVNPYTLADLTNKYEIDPAEYGTQTATGGAIAHVPAQSAIQLSVTGTNGSSALLRTHTHYRYQPGKMQRVLMTLLHADTGKTNQVREWGYFDANDGLFFSLSGTTLQVVQRSSTSGSAVDTAIAQASWNFDKMDGSGPSGVTLDITKLNIYEVRFAYLGAGDVQFFINDLLVHEIFTPNTLAAPYMKTGQLPLSWRIANTGASTASSVTYACSSVMSMGGEPPRVLSFAAFNAADITVTTTERPILSVRPKLTYNSIVNRMVLVPFQLNLSTETDRLGFRIVVNTVLTGAAFASVDANSGAEFDVAATSGAGGTTLKHGLIPLNSSIDFNLEDYFAYEQRGRKLRLDAFGSVQDVLTIFAVDEAAGTTPARASLAWKEVR